MAQEGKPDAQLFQLLSGLLHQVLSTSSFIQFFQIYSAVPVMWLIIIWVEALTNQEEVELRSKIEALGLEVTKVPPKSSRHLDELEIAKELDKLSAKLDDVDEMISSAMASDPQVKSLLSGTADVWMPVITATADERRTFTASVADDNPNPEAKGESLT